MNLVIYPLVGNARLFIIFQDITIQEKKILIGTYRVYSIDTKTILVWSIN